MLVLPGIPSEPAAVAELPGHTTLSLVSPEIDTILQRSLTDDEHGGAHFYRS
jgi:hypothetical protein